MYLKEVRLWNYRKFGSGNNELNLTKPDVIVPFSKGLNVLIGENDSGKSAIVDAIKVVLKTHSPEWIGVDDDDFYMSSTRMRIECEFDEFTVDEAKHFTEWLSWRGEGEAATPFLVAFIDVSRKTNRILPFDVRAGIEDGIPIHSDAREFLKVTYLRPLRDAKAELIPRKNSRLSQILSGHDAFRGDEADHHLIHEFNDFNKSVESYFDGKKSDGTDLTEDQRGKELKEEIDKYLKLFSNKTTRFQVSEPRIRQILERLELAFKNEMNLGLGSHNLLFVSSELLHLKKKNWHGLRLGLIEEIEAHLHPLAQLQVMESLQLDTSIQLIATTHSPNIGSKTNLKNLLLCHGSKVYSLSVGKTKLQETDYKFLQRFLDVTKANLFFAKGVILVEGWSEEQLLPMLALKIGINLSEKGVSVVNVGNTAALRYCKIFQRHDGNEDLKVPVAVITDLDVKPADEATLIDGRNKRTVITERKQAKYSGGRIKAFVSPHWTLEYCLALSPLLREHLFEAVKRAGNEMQLDGYSGKQVTENWANISNGKDEPTLAAAIYDQFIGGGKEISKAIIAQHLADILSDITLDQAQLEEDQAIAYLFKAIKYASSN